MRSSVTGVPFSKINPTVNTVWVSKPKLVIAILTVSVSVKPGELTGLAKDTGPISISSFDILKEAIRVFVPSGPLYSPVNQKVLSSTGSIVFVDASFTVSGIGLVVSGIIKGEPINNKQKMWFGPYQGQYHEVTIRSIHNSISQNVESVTDSEFACFAIKPINNKINLNRKKFKKGTVLISDMELFKNNIKKTFNAEVTILHHNTTIRDGYAPVIHLNNNRQSAKIKIIDKKFIRSGEKANILFEFAYYPVFIEVGNIFFFRDGNTKGVGHVISI